MGAKIDNQQQKEVMAGEGGVETYVMFLQHLLDDRRFRRQWVLLHGDESVLRAGQPAEQLLHHT